MNANQVIADAMQDGGRSEVLLILMEAVEDAVSNCQQAMNNPDHDDPEFWRSQLSLAIQNGQEAIVAASQNDLETTRRFVMLAQKEEMKLGDDPAFEWPMRLVNAMVDLKGDQ